MKTSTYRFFAPLAKIQKEHIQFFFLAVAVLMLALGAGAPADGGTIGH